MGKIYVLGDDHIERLLGTALVGRIACCSHAPGEAGRPYVVPLAYGYDGEGVYAFSGPGRKIEIMRSQPLISFEVDEAAAEDRWSSVIAEGVYEELTTPQGRELAHRVIFGDRKDIPPFADHHIVYRLHLTRKTGRFELPDGEAPTVEQLGPNSARSR
ncbi:MAG: pyridoxamine 5'-phosphate oxidase family protein [Chloroflexota bacterium]|nr:pyridoxamine 5'-phosphate oxidase family protein [Chloroflexota bacterium]